MRRILGFFRHLFTHQYTFGQLLAAVSLVALVCLCFMLGAVVMYFDLLSATWLRGTFDGARLLVQGNRDDRRIDVAAGKVNWTAPSETGDGLTLITTTQGAEATLIDMEGKEVHHWKMPGARPWPKVLNVPDPAPGQAFLWQRCHLFSNGDLLALCARGRGSPYGYGLAKLDKNSNLIWGFGAQVHHDFDVDDQGRIYALLQNRDQKPPSELELVAPTFAVDYVAVLSPEGKLLEVVSIFDAFRNSPYFWTLHPGEAVPPESLPPPVNPALGQQIPALQNQKPRPKFAFHQKIMTQTDMFHTNSVKVLTRELAPKFPQFKAGQVLLSMRTPSVVAVLDIPSRSIVWAARGVFQCQHDAQFLSNGRLLVFDNLGTPLGTRVLEYDPVSQAIPWWYGGDADTRFLSFFRGAVQRLPNGNTLIVQPETLKMIEVTPAKKIVWEWSLPSVESVADGPKHLGGVDLTGARRYARSDLEFLQSMGAP